MAGNQATIFIFLLFACCMSSIVAASLWGTNVLCDTTNPDSQVVGMDCPSVYKSSAPGPSALTPLQILQNSGQKLQGDSEMEIGTSTVLMSPQPVLPTVCSYSMSMDLKIAGTFPTWQCILESSNGVDWTSDDKVVPNKRRPLVGFTGTDVAPANQPFVNHCAADNSFQGDGLWSSSGRVNTPIPSGTWFNFAFTIDNAARKGILYINGVKISEFSATKDFAWPDPPTTWTWNNDVYNHSVSVKLKNAYFFSKVLTASEISTIGSSTTSTYVPQPLQVETSAYTKEVYTPY